MVMFYTYVLKSFKNGNLYTGSTNNIVRRLSEHNNGQTKYTKIAGPFELIYKETYNTKTEAIKREKFLKTGKGRELLKEILGS
jgi:putative endonuclease